MTEAEWLACDDPIKLIECCSSRLTERKVRLFALHACRACPTLPAHDRLEFALDRGEQFIEGPVGQWELAEARKEVEWGIGEMCDSLNRLSEAVEVVIQPSPPNRAGAELVVHSLGSVHTLIALDGREDESYPHQCELLRELVPFRPVALDPAWLTPTVVALARGVYDEKAFDRLPILADALQDAGCDNEDVLGHCRGPGAHARGCWVVDLVLGKA